MSRLRATGLLALVQLTIGMSVQTRAQAPLPPTTKVTPGSPEASFGPTAYSADNKKFPAAARELDATQRQMTQIAERKASPAVQAFAKQVRLSFSGGPSSLRGMSDDQGVPIVGTAAQAREHQTLVNQMQADAADVDRLFVDFEVLLLQEALGLVEPYATGGTDARWRETAAKAASANPILLAAARALQKP